MPRLVGSNTTSPAFMTKFAPLKVMKPPGADIAEAKKKMEEMDFTQDDRAMKAGEGSIGPDKFFNKITSFST